MKKINSLVLFCLSLLIALRFVPASAAGGARVQIHNGNAEPFPDKVGYNTVLYFSVFDSNEEPVKGLNESNFRLFEDENERTIDSVNAVTNESISIAFLMDTSGSMLGQALFDARAASSAFLERLGRNDRSAVLSFDEEMQILQDFTDDHYSSSETARQIEAVNGKGTCLYDSLYSAMELSLKEPNGRRALVLLTDGKDEMITGEVCSVRSKEDVIKFSQQNRIPIYIIGLGSKIDEQTLKHIAVSSSGDYILSNNSAELDASFSKLYQKLNNEYKISFTSGLNAGDHTILLEMTQDEIYGNDSYTLSYPAGNTIMVFDTPKENNTLCGEASLSVSFLAQSAEISRVQYFHNGQIIGETIRKPYEFLWDIRDLKSAENTSIEAIALDKSGAELARVEIPVSIQEFTDEMKPSISFENPQMNSEQQGSIDISVSVESRGESVGRVEYNLDGKVFGSSVEPPYHYLWDISDMASGMVEIGAIAYSTENKELTRAKVTVHVNETPKEKFSSSTGFLDNKVWIAMLGGIAVTLGIVLIIKNSNDRKREEAELEGGEFNVVNLPTPPQQGSGGVVSAADAEPKPFDVGASLEVISSDNSSLIGKRAEIRILPFKIGRAAVGNDLILESDTISRKHAVIENVYNEAAIRDLNSTNGTYVNDEPVTGLPIQLKSGDVIRLGKNERLRYKTESISEDDKEGYSTRIFMDNATQIHFPGEER